MADFVQVVEWISEEENLPTTSLTNDINNDYGISEFLEERLFTSYPFLQMFSSMSQLSGVF